MTENQIEQRFADQGNSVLMVQVVNVLLRQRLIVLAVPLVFVFGAVALSLLKHREYSASGSFVPQDAGTASSVAGFAAQLGMSVGSGHSPAESPEFYASLVKSRAILTTAAAGNYRVGGKPMTLQQIFGTDGPQDLNDRLQRDIRTTYSRTTGVVRIEAKTRYPELSEQIVDRLIALVNDFNLRKRQTRARAERDFTERRLKEKTDELRDAENRLQDFLQRNRQFERSPELSFQHERLQRDVAARETLVTMLTQSYEQSRLDEVRNLPVVTVIEIPWGTARPVSRGTVLRVLIALVLGGLLGVFIAFSRDTLQRGRRAGEAEYEEFTRLRSELIRDLRSPLKAVARGN